MKISKDLWKKVQECGGIFQENDMILNDIHIMPVEHWKLYLLLHTRKIPPDLFTFLKVFWYGCEDFNDTIISSVRKSTDYSLV